MLIRVMYQNDSFDMVKPALLDELISSNRIRKFLRSEGWTTIGIDPVRERRFGYRGPERRKTMMQGLSGPPARRQEDRSSGGSAMGFDERPQRRDASRPAKGEGFRSVYENAPIGIELYDREGILLDVNKACLEIFGVDDISAVKGFDLFGDPNLTDEQKKELREGRSLRQEIAFDFDLVKRRNLYPTAREGLRYLDVHIAPLAPLDMNENLGYLVYVRDITVRKKAEDRLLESEKKLRDITSHIGEGIYVFDSDGRITFMNSEAERLLGWTITELNERGAHETVHSLRADGRPLSFEDCEMHNVLKTGKRFFSNDEVFVRRDGTVFPISVIASPISEDGNIVGSVVAFRDITELKKLEQELLKAQKLESVGVLAGGIAHDFNNLLQIIMGNISLARTYEDPGSRRSELLELAEQASEQAKDLSYRLLTFSSGGKPHRRVTSLSKLLIESVNLSLSGSNVSCVFDIADDLSAVDIDEGQIRQAVSAIVVNAREATPNGGILRVDAGNVAVTAKDRLPLKEGDYLHILVKDEGVGIPVENLAKIFDPYFSTKERGSEKGTGLGLTISHSIIKKHDGLLTVESQEGRGTAFHIYLPAAQEEIITTATRRRTGVAGKRSILLMDDDPRVRYIGTEMLLAMGHEVEAARSGEEAIEVLKKARESGRTFDAVILDLTVKGGMGGKQVLAKLKEIDPEIKAVVSSGYAHDPIMKDFRTYGFVNAIAKPYGIEQLKELLASLE
ncbi:MAG TPA: PAS domain S-box protein [Thermodesulfovibrionales bacterium]|nr:PAS domain S-box protein [Thermodesulfovibrionales bacterium]